MKFNKLGMFYHEQTNTRWATEPDWEERQKTEPISIGRIEVNIDNVFEMKRHMESQGYHMVKENPYKTLEGVSKAIENK